MPEETAALFLKAVSGVPRHARSLAWIAALLLALSLFGFVAESSRTVALTLIVERPSLDAAQPRLTSP